MHEPSQRIKNTLTVVQAIVNQSFSRQHKDAEESISAHINAYAHAHDVVLQMDWLSATMDTIVEATAVPKGS